MDCAIRIIERFASEQRELGLADICNLLVINNNAASRVVEALVEVYMQLGGMKMQITCASPEPLRAAYENPDEHRNLIVRVGGYSEYFYRLSDELRRTVMNRSVRSAGR